MSCKWRQASIVVLNLRTRETEFFVASFTERTCNWITIRSILLILYCVSVKLLRRRRTAGLQIQHVVQSHKVTWRGLRPPDLLYDAQRRSRQPSRCWRRRLSNRRHFVSDRQASQLRAEDSGTSFILKSDQIIGVCYGYIGVGSMYRIVWTLLRN